MILKNRHTHIMPTNLAWMALFTYLHLCIASHYVKTTYFEDDACTRNSTTMQPLFIKAQSACQASYPMSYSNVVCNAEAGTAGMIVHLTDNYGDGGENVDCRTDGDHVRWAYVSTNTLVYSVSKNASMGLPSKSVPLACRRSENGCTTLPDMNVLGRCNQHSDGLWFRVECASMQIDPEAYLIEKGWFAWLYHADST